MSAMKAIIFRTTAISSSPFFFRTSPMNNNARIETKLDQCVLVSMKTNRTVPRNVAYTVGVTSIPAPEMKYQMLNTNMIY